MIRLTEKQKDNIWLAVCILLGIAVIIFNAIYP